MRLTCMQGTAPGAGDTFLQMWNLCMTQRYVGCNRALRACSLKVVYSGVCPKPYRPRQVSVVDDSQEHPEQPAVLQ